MKVIPSFYTELDLISVTFSVSFYLLQTTDILLKGGRASEIFFHYLYKDFIT